MSTTFRQHFRVWPKKHLDRELQVENDNDIYTLDFTSDQYYSNGVAIRYRILADPSKWNDGFEKTIRFYHINHRIYSPKRIWWENSADMDRPYAGQLSLAISNEYYFKNQSYADAKLELGLDGPFSESRKTPVSRAQSLWTGFAQRLALSDQ